MPSCWGAWQHLHREVEEETHEGAGGQRRGPPSSCPPFSDVIASVLAITGGGRSRRSAEL